MMKFSREIGGEKIDQVINDGIEAQELGFDQVWIPDHLVDIQVPFAIYDTWTVQAFLGAKTTMLRLGSGVTDIQRMHPAKIASTLSTLDNLTRGRVILGIGAGEIMNTRPYGIEWEEKGVRIKRLREFLLLCKLLWSSSEEKPASFEGEFYRLDNAFLNLSPVQKPHPPIYIGAFSSKAMLRLVGEIADGWYPGSLNSLDSFQEKVQVIKESATKAGRAFQSLDIMASVLTLVCRNDEELTSARNEAKQSMKREMITNQYIMKVLGLREEDVGNPPSKELEYQHAVPSLEYDRKLSEAVEKISIPDEVLEKGIERAMAIGSVDDCISSLERFKRAGATHIFFSNVAGSRENYRRIGKEIIPRLRG